MPRIKKELKTKSKTAKIKNITNTEKISKTTNRISLPKPSKVKCFMNDCGKIFFIAYNPAVGMPSQKNYGNYWVDKNGNYKEVRRKTENERGDKICSDCLRNIYLSKRWEFLDQIQGENKRQTLRSYIYHNII